MLTREWTFLSDYAIIIMHVVRVDGRKVYLIGLAEMIKSPKCVGVVAKIRACLGAWPLIETAANK